MSCFRSSSWFLAVFGALSLLATDRLASGTLPFQTLGLGAVVGSVLALPMLFIPALLDRGQPTRSTITCR